MTKFRNQAYTLTEVIMVIVIVAVIASFTLPNFRRAREAEYERSARHQLLTIYKAEQIYMAKAKTFWPETDSTVNDLDVINDALALNINTDGMEDGIPAKGGYSCTRSGGVVKCTGTRDGGTFRLGVCVHINDTICCDAGACPTAAMPNCPC